MEPDMRKTRIAIVGTGLAATPHALALNDLRDEVEVVGVLGRSRERLESFAHQYGFPLGESFEKMLNDPGVDAILVLTPPHTHLDLVLQAAAAGKHVLLEKPLDISTQRAERLCKRAATPTCGSVSCFRIAFVRRCSGLPLWCRRARSAHSSMPDSICDGGVRSLITMNRAGAPTRAMAGAY